MSVRNIYSRRTATSRGFRRTRPGAPVEHARDVEAQATVTLRDVAHGSGVSITTVSRILNGRESGVPIRDETRQRVLSVAAELGYKPNLLARGPARQPQLAARRHRA